MGWGTWGKSGCLILASLVWSSLARAQVPPTDGAEVAAHLRQGREDGQASRSEEARVFSVKPGQWFSTGIQLRKGERFEVTASGMVKADASWRNREWGPNGFYWIGFSAYTLKGLVSDKLIEIGDKWGGTAPADGELKLGITRTYEKINAEDSGFTGSFTATVTTFKPKH